MCFHFLNEQSRVYQAADPYAVSEYVNAHVGSHDLRLARSGETTAALAHRKFGNIDLCRLTYGRQARVISDGLHDIYHLQFILKGHCRYEMHTRHETMSAGNLLVINPDDPIDLTYSDDCEKFIMRIPTTLLQDACMENRWLRPQSGIRFSPIPYKFQELESLLYLLTLICQEAESGMVTPQLLGHYNRVISTKLMTMLKHNVALEAPCSTTVSFEHLVQYIEENLKRDISVEELARHARLSTRSLYMLFEKHAKTTPKNFIRQKKLEAVYNSLMDPACRVANITAIALDYGFTHLGRFSESYRETFGMLPSESLRERMARLGH